MNIGHHSKRVHEFKGPEIFLFADGTRHPEIGGTTVLNLLKNSVHVEEDELPRPDLKARIVGIGCRYKGGSIERIAAEWGIPFYLLPAKPTRIHYQRILREFPKAWFVLSGYLRKVYGLPMARTVNIHEALLSLTKEDGSPLLGGDGMYRKRVYQETERLLKDGKLPRILTSFGKGHAQRIVEYLIGVSMHFVSEGPLDSGPVFCEYVTPVSQGTDAAHLADILHGLALAIHPALVNQVVHGEIGFDEEGNLKTEPWYLHRPEDWRRRYLEAA